MTPPDPGSLLGAAVGDSPAGVSQARQARPAGGEDSRLSTVGPPGRPQCHSVPTCGKEVPQADWQLWG